MKSSYTEAQHKATNKYRRSRGQITLTVDKALKDKWQAQADAEGVSLTKWIISKVEAQ